MLEIRPNCECCDKDLPPDSLEAMICTFECTFCASCADAVLHGVCPNCGGNLARADPPAPPAGKISRVDTAGVEGGRMRSAGVNSP